MEIFVRDAESKTGKWRRIIVNVSAWFTDVTSDTERRFHFRAVERGFEDV